MLDHRKVPCGVKKQDKGPDTFLKTGVRPPLSVRQADATVAMITLTRYKARKQAGKALDITHSLFAFIFFSFFPCVSC